MQFLADVLKETGQGCLVHNYLYKPQLANNPNVDQWQNNLDTEDGRIKSRKKQMQQNHSGNMERSQRQDERTYAA